MTITIPSDNKASRGDVVIKQIFYVLDDCTPYDFNPNYYDKAKDVVITKGKVVNGSWKLEMNISEVFKMQNGKNIFQYFNTVNNAVAINFALVPDPQPGVSYTEAADKSNGTIALTAPMTTSEKTVKMKYDVKLVNGENCTFYFNVLFRNPFVATAAQLSNLRATKSERSTWPPLLCSCQRR